jgi:hypothetical protein
MPFGIFIILKLTFMHYVYDPKEFAARIDAYFHYIKGEYHIEKVPSTTSKKETGLTEKIIWDRLPEPVLLTGLALFLGFSSKQELEEYERRGRHKLQLRRARLRVEAEYEKRLHQQSPTGAIFALKSMGWTDKVDSALQETRPKNLRIEIVEAGPQVAGSEKDVAI